MSLYQVKSDYFVAGFCTANHKVVKVAPIIKYMKGWNLSRALEYAKSKGWKTEKVKRHET